MLQTALRDKTKQTPRSQISTSRSLTAPVKGWYVGSPLAGAPDLTAYLLENGFPEIDYVRARGGSTSWATGMPSAPVNTLMPYRAVNSGGIKLFASCNGSIYDVTNTGPVGAALVTGLNASASFSFVQFAASGAQTLLAANGVDVVQLFDGTSWGTAPAITGLTGSPLNYLWTYQSNIWALQPNSLDAWYLPGSTIGGAIQKYPMSPLFKFGGSLIAGGTWTIPTVTGLEVANIFITDQGEICIAVGSTPALAGWQVQGVYKVSPPVGPYCVLQTGGDMAIMTQDGIIAASEIQTKAEIALQNSAVTAAIRPEWQKATKTRLGLNGWQIVAWPMTTMIIINLPQANSADRTQFIANGRTGGWARYFGWDARCFAVGGQFLEKLFYGTSNGIVAQAENGGSDLGAPYTMTIFPSFTDLGKTDYGFPSLSQSAGRKQVKMVRPRIQTDSNISPLITVNVDFDITLPAAPPSGGGQIAGAKWDVAKWDIDVWPKTLFLLQDWRSAEGIGSTVAPIIGVTFQQTATPDVRLTSTDILFESGNLFG